MSLLIEIKNVYKNHLQHMHSGVSGVSLEINEGEIVSIVGESGSGKSTLLKLIYGLLIPQEGQILFEGKKVLGPDEKLIAGHDSMKMVTQDVTLNLYARVFDNIASLLPNTDLERKQNLTLQTMELLKIDHLANKKIVDLSGGEQQRVAIARAIVTSPRVLLLDEPFSQVDTILKRQLRDDIENLAKTLRITIIIVSHDPFDGLSLADNMVIIRSGKIIKQGKPRDIFQNPELSYIAKLLGGANIISNLANLPKQVINYACYPHDIILFSNDNSIKATIKAVHFCGYFNAVDLLVENQLITVYDYHFNVLEKEQIIDISFRNIKELID